MQATTTITTRSVSRARAKALTAAISRPDTRQPQLLEAVTCNLQPQPRCTCRFVTPIFKDNTTAQAIADHFADQPGFKVIHPFDF